MTAARLAAGLVAIVALTAGGGSATRPETKAPARPLLADSVATLEAALAGAGIGASVEAAEEGSFMLGAYPRSRVFWRIRLRAALPDSALASLADDALALRAGVVWISVPQADGSRRLVTYSDGNTDN